MSSGMCRTLDTATMLSLQNSHVLLGSETGNGCTGRAPYTSHSFKRSHDHCQCLYLLNLHVQEAGHRSGSSLTTMFSLPNSPVLLGSETGNRCIARVPENLQRMYQEQSMNAGIAYAGHWIQSAFNPNYHAQPSKQPHSAWQRDR